MNRAGDILAIRHEQRLAARTQALTSQNTSSIEASVNNSSSSIEIYVKAFDQTVEIPAEVDELIDDKRFRSKYGTMICRGFKAQLLQLARLTRSMESAGKLREAPSHFFSRYAKNANWERTLKFLAELTKVQQLAERVAKKLKTAVAGFIYQQVWRGANVERWSDLAQEAPHDKPGQSAARHFTWLCRREAAQADKSDIRPEVVAAC
jgi:hypothetical protein